MGEHALCRVGQGDVCSGACVDGKLVQVGEANGLEARFSCVCLCWGTSLKMARFAPWVVEITEALPALQNPTLRG